MNLPAVNHRPTQEFIYPASRNELILQLFTAAKDIDEVTLLYWERYEQDPSKIHRKKLSVSLRDDQRDCYRTSIACNRNKPNASCSSILTMQHWMHF